MAERGRLEVYKCGKCGNTCEVVFAAGGTLSCCGQPMDLQTEQTADLSKEKHVPIIEKTENGVLVKVGSTDHPMTKEHYIQWIEVINGDYVQRKYLKPGDKPQAEFWVRYNDNLIAREFCNLHGNWRN